MNFLQSKMTFLIFLILSVILFIVSIADVVFYLNWFSTVIISYAIILILLVVFFFMQNTSSLNFEGTVEEFEKTLKGGLYHFKCPNCQGLFAVKKSKKNNKKPVKMTCPDCGFIATIPSNPKQIEQEIPEKKSIGVNFRCNHCGEGITIWAEGADLFSDVQVFSCPFCGLKKNMKKI